MTALKLFSLYSKQFVVDFTKTGHEVIGLYCIVSFLPVLYYLAHYLKYLRKS